MYNQNIQDALNKLDRGAKTKRRFRALGYSLAGVAIALLIGGGLWMYAAKPSTTLTADQLSRLIIIASRNSDNDPIRLLSDLERQMGKRIQELSMRERADALDYLMDHIELNHNHQELVHY